MNPMNPRNHKNPRTGKFLFALLFLLVLLSFSCGTDEADGGNDPAETKALAVKTVTAANRRLDNDLMSFGSIIYKTKNDITAQVSGTITSLTVKEGDPVQAGEILAVLRNVQMEIQKEQYENTRESARAALVLAETKMREERLSVESRLLALERSDLHLKQQELELENALENLASQTELHKLGGITDSAYKSLQLSISSKEADIAILKKEIEIAELGLRDGDLREAGYSLRVSPEQRKNQLMELNTRSVAAEIESARANLRNAEKSLDSMEKLLEELTIRSSVTGIVGALYFENGEFVPQNEKIATVMDIEKVYAVFTIQEQDMIHFNAGTPLTIELPSLTRNITGTIDEISPMADPQTGNFSVKAELDNRDLLIKPGMFVRCVIPRAEDLFYPAFPETALVEKDGQDGRVFCAVNGFAVLKTVRIQDQKDGLIWASGGIADGELIIDKPSPFLKEGDYVRTD